MLFSLTLPLLLLVSMLLSGCCAAGCESLQKHPQRPAAAG
jgi:hypothetical protein